MNEINFSCEIEYSFLNKHHSSKHSIISCSGYHTLESQCQCQLPESGWQQRGSIEGAAGPRDQLQQRLQLLPNPNPNRQPLPWQEVKQVPACVQSGWPLFSDTGEDADPKA